MNEEDLKQDIDDTVRGFSRLITSRGESTGIPPPARVDVSESALDPVRFDFQLGRGVRSDPVGDGGGVPSPALHCPAGAEITVQFSGIASCGCLTDGSSSYKGTDLGGLNATFVLPRISSTEFALTGLTLFNLKSWFSNSTCAGTPSSDVNNGCTVYARCIEASGMWTVAIEDTTAFYFAFFASVASQTLPNECSCSPFVFSDLFHNGTAIVTF